jgi:hypothetical protein
VGVAEEEEAVSTEARDLAVETERLARLNYALGPGTSLDLAPLLRSLLATARCAPPGAR